MAPVKEWNFPEKFISSSIKTEYLEVRWKVISEGGSFSATLGIVANHLKVVKHGAGVLVDIVATHLAHGDGGVF